VVFRECVVTAAVATHAAVCRYTAAHASTRTRYVMQTFNERIICVPRVCRLLFSGG